MTKSISTKAIVLKRTNYGEADRILHLLTPSGQYSAIAKGVRKEKSKLAGGVEILAINDVVINQGRSELGIITSARLEKFFGNILKDYDRLQFANLLLKTVNKASVGMSEDIWYELTKDVFESLDNLSTPLALVETWFYLRYASYEGHEMNLSLDIDGNQLQSDGNYMYDVENRGLKLIKSDGISSEHIKILRVLSLRPIEIAMKISGLGPYIDVCRNLAREHAALSIN